jgi:AcrR family transcriptional regulator
MPKQRITKEMVMDAAFQLLREGGEEQVLVKSIAAALSCSVQPIYSYCENMDALRQEISEMAADFMRNYIGEHLNKENPFESTGKAYISFAKEEPHLFKSYFLRKRSGINSFDDLYAAEAEKNMAAYLAKTLGISESSAKKLHMNMIVYNMGLSFMMISAGCNLSEQELGGKLEGAYKAFLSVAKNEGVAI